MSWGPGRQNSPRLAQSSGGPSAPRPGPHDYSPNSGSDQRVVNGGVCPMSRRNPLSLHALHHVFVIFDSHSKLCTAVLSLCSLLVVINF